MNDIPLHNPDEWELGESLGEGGLSVGVFKAKKRDKKINNFILPNDGECVIKIIMVKNDENKLYKKECSIIDKLMEIYDGLRGVIQYYGYSKYIDENNIEYIYIYMEYLDGYESIGKLLKEKNKFSEEEVGYIGQKLMCYVKILHDNNIVHRDIKCDNILLNISNGDIKLIDFGISKYCESINKTGYHTNAGTGAHIAPEVSNIKAIKINKSDIWSIGCTLLELLGSDLRIGNPTDHIGNLLIQCSELKSFIQHCLVTEPISRDYFLFRHVFKIQKWPNDIYGLLKTPYLLPNDILKSLLNKIYSIQSSVTSLDLPSFNEPITPSLIPSSVNKVHLPSFNHPITPDSIPSSVTILDLPSFNHPITPDSIPSSVTELDLRSFNQPIKQNSIPSSVKSLYLFLFNQPIKPDSIPSSVTELYLFSFNQSITANSIPSSVKLLFLSFFDQPITPNSIPSSVTVLDLRSFNQPIKPNLIPSSVKSLNLASFNQPIKPNSIPSSVTKLYLPSFNQPITPNSIPSLVTKLDLPSFSQPIALNSIPSAVTVLDLGSFNQPLKPNLIPSSVTELYLPSFNQPITPNSIPSSVTKLDLSSFDQPITPNSIPSSVTELDLSSFNQNLEEDSLPSLLHKLKLNNFDLNEHGDFLPVSVLTFQCNFNFKSPLRRNNNIPKKISTLILQNYNHSITKESIQTSVISIELGSDFKHFESFKNLPTSIITLSFGVVNCKDDDESIKSKIPKHITNITINRK